MGWYRRAMVSFMDSFNFVGLNWLKSVKRSCLSHQLECDSLMFAYRISNLNLDLVRVWPRLYYRLGAGCRFSPFVGDIDLFFYFIHLFYWVGNVHFVCRRCFRTVAFGSGNVGGGGGGGWGGGHLRARERSPVLHFFNFFGHRGCLTFTLLRNFARKVLQFLSRPGFFKQLVM